MTVAATPSRGKQTQFNVEPLVAAEIAEFAPLSGKRLVAALSTNERRVLEETLVHFLRREHSSGEAATCADIAMIVTERVSRNLAKLMRLWRLSHPPDLAEDVIDEILTDLYEQLFSTDNTAAFWEIRFWVCFNRMAINVVRRRRFDLDLIVAEQNSEPEDDVLEVEQHAPRIDLDSPENAALLNDALARLSQPVRTAFLLKHWAGHAEESRTKDEPSIAALMGVTGRTVRNYLARATRELEAWRAEGSALAQ